MFAARIDEFGKAAWIGLLVVSFVMFWPLGLILLGFIVGSGRMGCWSQADGGQRWRGNIDRMQRKMDRMQAAAERFWGPRPASSGPSSGNAAFDEYRTETLRRLEEEQREFLDFLQRLRHAKDKAEFDQFMAERRRAPETGSSPQL